MKGKTFYSKKALKGYFFIVCILLILLAVLGTVIPYSQKVSAEGEAVWVTASGTYIQNDHYTIDGVITGYLIPVRQTNQFDGTIQIDSLEYTQNQLYSITYWEKGYLTYTNFKSGEDGFLQTIGPAYMKKFPDEAVIMAGVEDGEILYIVLGASTVEEANQKIAELVQ